MIARIRCHSPSSTLLALGALVAIGCGGNGGSSRSDTSSAAGALAATSDTSVMIRGTIARASASDLVITSDTGSVTVQLTPPVQVFDREPATLADVKDNTFIGVTTVKQPDGSERATEIHIFPEALRGMGEGSRMMAQNAGGGGNRMTNGAVSGSRMSNGNVASANGSTLVVQYAGGSQRVTVPPNTSITQLAPTSTTLAPGASVVVVATRGAGGSLTASKVLLSGK